MTGLFAARGLALVATTSALFCSAAHAAERPSLISLPADIAGIVDGAHAGAIRGLVVPVDHATIASRLQATIIEIGPGNGESFKAGDRLVAFDCGTFDAGLERAQADADAARQNQAIKQELARSGSASRLQATLAGAELKRAVAEVHIAERQVAECEIRAPYDGKVVRRIANAHETTGYRDPLLEIIGDRNLEIKVYVPSLWIAEMKSGTPFQFTVDETHAVVDAEIITVGASIDNVSQLVEVRAKVVSPTSNLSAGQLSAGMSGNATFEGLDR